MRLVLLIALLAAALPACQTGVEPMTLDEFGGVLRAQGLDEPYAGAAEAPLFFTRELWRAALRGEDPLVIDELTFYRREPAWEEAWWRTITTGLDASLTASGWSRLAPDVSDGATVRSWARGQQRLAIGRVDLYGDSTSFVTAVLAGD